jgi:hypothetical protein
MATVWRLRPRQKNYPIRSTELIRWDGSAETFADGRFCALRQEEVDTVHFTLQPEPLSQWLISVPQCSTSITKSRLIQD